jgi:hypothetical protein
MRIQCLKYDKNYKILTIILYLPLHILCKLLWIALHYFYLPELQNSYASHTSHGSIVGTVTKQRLDGLGF